MQSKPKKKSVRTLASGKIESHMYVPDRPKKKKSAPKKKYICVDTSGNASKPQESVEKAYTAISDMDTVDTGASDCSFYEVKEVKVITGVRLA